MRVKRNLRYAFDRIAAELLTPLDHHIQPALVRRARNMSASFSSECHGAYFLRLMTWSDFQP
jgi:hypothetical protein